jgi:hypothetical protein
MKTGTIKLIGGLAIAYILFSSFKKKGNLVGDVKVYDYQNNTPTNVPQVFSQIGTIVYDNNGGIIYTYDTPGLGMALTGEKNDMFSVVIGQDFMNGIAGFVYKNDVQVIN